MFCWEPKGSYRHRLCTSIAPFWFLTEDRWIGVMPFLALRWQIWKVTRYLTWWTENWAWQVTSDEWRLLSWEGGCWIRCWTPYAGDSGLNPQPWTQVPPEDHREWKAGCWGTLSRPEETLMWWWWWEGWLVWEGQRLRGAVWWAGAVRWAGEMVWVTVWEG